MRITIDTDAGKVVVAESGCGGEGGGEIGGEGDGEGGGAGGGIGGVVGGENGGKDGREGGRESGKESGRESGKESGREGGRESGREGGREGGREKVSSFDLYSRAGFEALSRVWRQVAWHEKYTYTFSWLGRPMIQLADDMMRLQEVIYRVKPDVIVETGVAHGGGLVFYAGLCAAMGKGRVIGVDVEIRAHNRAAIEAHELFDRITLVEGSSVDEAVVRRVGGLVDPGEVVLVVLDSDHSAGHVGGELEAYADLVSPGSYVVATDGVMAEVCDTPRGKATWSGDHPGVAARKFACSRRDFVLEVPAWPFNESVLDAGSEAVTHWPGAWLRRLSDEEIDARDIAETSGKTCEVNGG